MIRRRVYYEGIVQGVGFRWTALRTAARFAVAGFVRNLDDGRVEVVAEGERDEVARFCAVLEDRMGECVRRKEEDDFPASGEFGGFTIEP